MYEVSPLGVLVHNTCLSPSQAQDILARSRGFSVGNSTAHPFHHIPHGNTNAMRLARANANRQVPHSVWRSSREAYADLAAALNHPEVRSATDALPRGGAAQQMPATRLGSSRRGLRAYRGNVEEASFSRISLKVARDADGNLRVITVFLQP